MYRPKLLVTDCYHLLELSLALPKSAQPKVQAQFKCLVSKILVTLNTCNATQLRHLKALLMSGLRKEKQQKKQIKAKN